MICGDNTCEGMGRAYSRAQSLTAAHTGLETCGCTHERARAQSRHSYTLKSRTGDMSMMRFGHPPTDEHSWQNAAGRSWVGGDRGRDPHHSGYSRVCGGSHRAHPDLCSIRGDMPHCSPLWVYIRGTEARVTGETGALVMGTCLSLVPACQRRGVVRCLDICTRTVPCSKGHSDFLQCPHYTCSL